MIECEAMLMAKNKDKVLKCSRLARYKLNGVNYCAEHASLRLLNEAKLEGKIEELK